MPLTTGPIEHCAVGGIIADQAEGAFAAAEIVVSVEPRAVSINRRHSRLLRREFDLAGNMIELALVGDLTDEIGETVRAGDQRRNGHAAAAVDAGEGLVEARFRIKPGSGHVEPAERASEAVERQRPIDPRAPRDDSHGYRGP
jgi:hypothetical protein